MAEQHVLVNIQIPAGVRDEFKIAAKLKGSTMSALLYQHILKTVREEKEKMPSAFPDHVPVDNDAPDKVANRFEVYAEAFGAEDLDTAEWQYLEMYFKDKIDEWRSRRPVPVEGHTPEVPPVISGPTHDQGEVEKPKRKAG